MQLWKIVIADDYKYAVETAEGEERCRSYRCYYQKGIYGCYKDIAANAASVGW